MDKCQTCGLTVEEHFGPEITGACNRFDPYGLDRAARCLGYVQSEVDPYALECVLCGRPRPEHQAPDYATEPLREDDGEKD